MFHGQFGQGQGQLAQDHYLINTLKVNSELFKSYCLHKKSHKQDEDDDDDRTK